MSNQTDCFKVTTAKTVVLHKPIATLLHKFLEPIKEGVRVLQAISFKHNYCSEHRTIKIQCLKQKLFNFNSVTKKIGHVSRVDFTAT